MWLTTRWLLFLKFVVNSRFNQTKFFQTEKNFWIKHVAYNNNYLLWFFRLLWFHIDIKTSQRGEDTPEDDDDDASVYRNKWIPQDNNDEERVWNRNRAFPLHVYREQKRQRSKEKAIELSSCPTHYFLLYGKIIN